MRGPQERIDDPYGGGPGGAHMPSEPSDLPPYMPTEQPVTRAPAGAPAYSREELFRRAVDPTLSPDHASVMKHIADWQAANPGEKLGVDRNTLLQASKQARGTAAKAAKTAKPVEPEVTPASKPVEASPEEKAAQAASDARTAELEKQSQEETAKANQAAAEQARAKIAEAEAKPEPEPKTEPEAKPAPLAKTGPEAEAAIAKTAQERVNRRGKAADEQAKGAVAEEKRAVNAEARATQREDEHTTREIAARDIRSEHTPGANMQAESARVKDALRAAHGAGIFDLLKPTVERARQILSDYAAKMKELAGKTTDHMVYRQFDPVSAPVPGPITAT
jgi:hypothetical protein